MYNEEHPMHKPQILDLSSDKFVVAVKRPGGEISFLADGSTELSRPYLTGSLDQAKAVVADLEMEHPSNKYQIMKLEEPGEELNLSENLNLDLSDTLTVTFGSLPTTEPVPE